MSMNNQPKIGKDFFEKLCALQCTTDEICGALNCSEQYLRNWCKETYDADYNEVYRVKLTKGKITLRNIQFEMAKKSPTMAMYLGRIYLNQNDKDDKRRY